ncbi:HD domain-containing protein [Natronospora cellulosivora (SeqCode)]
MITLNEIKENEDFRLMIEKANNYLGARGYTEHGFRHVNYVSKQTATILEKLNYDKKTIELGAIAGYLHDIGNMFNRKHHGVSSANIVYTELRRMNVPLEDIMRITTALANHEEEIGHAVTPITSALILADKSDAHRTRANKKNSTQIHDRVNLAIQDSYVEVEADKQRIRLHIDYDSSISQVMDYFEIYLHRMEMCKEAANNLGCRFHLLINNLELLGQVDYSLSEDSAKL